METVEQLLLSTLKELRAQEFNEFKFHLRECVRPQKDQGLQVIPACDLEDADRQRTVQLICQNYKNQALEVMQEVLRRIQRNDLVEALNQHRTPGLLQYNTANMM